MIKHYKFKLRHDGAQKINSNVAYPLYSELLKYVSADFAEAMHEQSFTPLSQHVELLNDTEIIWNVSLFGEETINEISPKLESLSDIKLETKEILLHTDEKIDESVITFDEIISEAANADDMVWQSIKLVSPTTFKSAGQYVLFPSSDLIIKSLVSKWNFVCQDYTLDDEDMLDMLLRGVKISGYRLSSTAFRIKGQNIPSFVGNLKLNARLSPPIMQIYKSLLLFGEYSGIGIKTALGMGGFELCRQLQK